MTEEKKGCVLGATNEQRVKSLEARMLTVENGIADIRDRLLGRPAWPVVIIITALSSLCVGLAVRVIAG